MNWAMLHPDGPWFWALYLLAGAGTVVWFFPRFMEDSDPMIRDTVNAHPGIRAFLVLITAAFWPLVLGWLLLWFPYFVLWWTVTVVNLAWRAVVCLVTGRRCPYCARRRRNTQTTADAPAAQCGDAT